MADVAIPGVSLAQYAAIRAAVAEGFALDAVLEVEGIPTHAFTRADLEWKRRIAGDQKLLDVYMAELARAEDLLARSVKPIADDVVAWVSFLAALEAHMQPFELLEHHGLGVNDLSRLQRRWAARIEQEPALDKRIAELRKKGSRPVVEISVGPPVLRPSRMATVCTKPSGDKLASLSERRLADEALGAESAVAALPVARAHDLHVTGPMASVCQGPALPFKPAEDGGLSAVFEPEPVRIAASLTGTAPMVDVPRGPALPFAGAAREADAHRRPNMLAETSLALDIPRGPLMPFVAGAGVGERGEGAGIDATRPVSNEVRGPLPAAEGTSSTTSGLEQTAPVLVLPRGDSLPFTAGASRWPASETPPVVVPHVAPGRAPAPSTAPMQERPCLLLTLEQHAALTLELALHPGQEAEVLARYSLTSEQKAQLDQEYRERVAASPEARAAWTTAYRAHYERLSRSRPPRR
ncbi:hypothetical protein [Polyangium fumosum]|uniref:Uncharacterized protein n=1 Tax=Polyangium fumosum TaxID=889272 RepID=A0A4U1IVX5_9BACT|nr:hypothetical protein [Polyangium fumosum]TKC98170.1 hypothetical protein E8A74_42335 [Polyangium fumosum]